MTFTLPVPSLTDAAAWVGALAGFGALLWQFLTWRRSSHHVKVTRTQSWFTYSDETLSEDLVCVSARNVGTGPVTVTSWGISMETRRENIVVVNPLQGSTELPHRLERGTSMSLFVRAADLMRARGERGVPLLRMRGWVGLATGQKVYAKRGAPISG